MLFLVSGVRFEFRFPRIVPVSRLVFMLIKVAIISRSTPMMRAPMTMSVWLSFR